MFLEEVSALRVSLPLALLGGFGLFAGMLVRGAGGGAGVRHWSRLLFLRLLCT